MPVDHKVLLPLLPDQPGVYHFIDDQGVILYVGKSSNIRKRVSSYFTRNQSGKTNALLRRSVRITHTVVETESEALLLENNLIKRHQPRYNILLKDDKTFPWICIRNEPFPRIFSTRTFLHDGSDYFGPYTSATMVRTLLGLIRQLFSLRTCSLSLTRQNIESGKFHVCLEYQIGNCRGPCEGRQTLEDYNQSVNQIREILRGNMKSVTIWLKERMTMYAAELKFEEAQKIKEKLDMLSRYQARSLVVNPSMGNVDVFGFSMEGDYAAVNFMRIAEGSVIQTYTIGLKRQLDETKEAILSTGMGEIIIRFGPLGKNVIAPFVPELTQTGTKLTVPAKGDKKHLLEMAQRNALYFRIEQKKRREVKSPSEKVNRNLDKLRNDLNMSLLPRVIECFDNSNIQGDSPVASCVVFRNGRPVRSEYRHFNIRGVSGPDDYASMEEVVFRRYRRILDEGRSLPDLVVVDGGKGQLSSAMQSLEKLGITGSLTVIGIAKRLEEIYFPGDSVPLYIDKNSVSLRIIQHIRNEAHRFGLEFHRLKRSRKMLESELDSIPGIGPATVKKLLLAFKTPSAVSAASTEQLRKVVGTQKAALIAGFYNGTGNVSRET
ncbi:MAG: excinuclease ABC subunit UvrC [Bacteroidetes bacterium]|nr:excinuclease ABC subunit UvrC [Bacteroidota bacterium]